MKSWAGVEEGLQSEEIRPYELSLSWTARCVIVWQPDEL